MCIDTSGVLDGHDMDVRCVLQEENTVLYGIGLMQPKLVRNSYSDNIQIDFFYFTEFMGVFEDAEDNERVRFSLPGSDHVVMMVDLASCRYWSSAQNPQNQSLSPKGLIGFRPR